MKRILYIVLAVLTIGASFVSCESDVSLPEINLSPETLKFSVTQDVQGGNEIILKNEDSTVIPFWKYFDANGNELGSSNKGEEKITIPFAGKYTVYFTAFTRGGSVEADPVVVNVEKTDLSSITTDPKWDMLTNGAAGKTWVLDMTDPVGWAGLDFPSKSGDNWSWLPDYASNSWVMTDKAWGEMTFDLDEAYNVKVTQTSLSGSDQTTKVGTFNFDIAGSKLTFIGGPEMLYGGDYYGDVSNWTTVKVVELTATSMRLAVIRNQSRSGEDVCLIVFHYKVKQ